MSDTYTDAIALLRADHRKVEDLFEQFEKARSSGQKAKLAREICTELKIHAMIEEEIFYPAIRDKVQDDTLNEAYVEHDGAKILINDIESSSPDEEYFDAKITVLSEEIKHHVREEERSRESMFAQCREADVDLVTLRDEMLARKQELMGLAKKGQLPRAETTVVHLS